MNKNQLHQLRCPCCGQCLMDAKFLLTLDKLEKEVGFELKFNSGFRCEDHNESVGGVSDSAHLKGKAADIHLNNSWEKYIILKAIFTLGLKRIGIYKSFLHVDIDYDKPIEIVW